MTHRDPVCGMNVEADTPHQTTYEGERYYFCSAGCKQSFEKSRQYKGVVGPHEVHSSFMAVRSHIWSFPGR